MSKPKISFPSADYIRVVSDLSKIANTKNACAPIAVALATDADVKDVVKFFNECGRIDGGFASGNMIKKVLNIIGYDVPDENHIKVMMKQFYEEIKKRRHTIKKITTKTIENNNDLFEKVFGKVAIVIVKFGKGKTHVIAYKDGRLHDMYLSRPRDVIWIMPIKKKMGR